MGRGWKSDPALARPGAAVTLSGGKKPHPAGFREGKHPFSRWFAAASGVEGGPGAGPPTLGDRETPPANQRQTSNSRRKRGRGRIGNAGIRCSRANSNCTLNTPGRDRAGFAAQRSSPLPLIGQAGGGNSPGGLEGGLRRSVGPKGRRGAARGRDDQDKKTTGWGAAPGAQWGSRCGAGNRAIGFGKRTAGARRADLWKGCRRTGILGRTRAWARASAPGSRRRRLKSNLKPCGRGAATPGAPRAFDLGARISSGGCAVWPKQACRWIKGRERGGFSSAGRGGLAAGRASDETGRTISGADAFPGLVPGCAAIGRARLFRPGERDLHPQRRSKIPGTNKRGLGLILVDGGTRGRSTAQTADGGGRHFDATLIPPPSRLGGRARFSFSNKFRKLGENPKAKRIRPNWGRRGSVAANLGTTTTGGIF